MKIEVIKNFYDKENDLALRSAGDELEVSAERGKALIDGGFAKKLKPVKSRSPNELDSFLREMLAMFEAL